MSQIKDFLKGTEENNQLKEQLQLLVSLAKSKLDGMTHEIENAFVNKETEQKFRVVPGTSTEWITEYRVNAGSECNKQISEVVDAFFEGKMVEGFKKLISTALNSFIGERSAGEQYKKYYFITMEHNTLIRVDVACWKYQFSSKNVIANVENAFCYSFCKSVVDYDTVSMSVLINQVSKLVHDDLSQVKEYLTEIREIFSFLAEMSGQNMLRSAGRPQLMANGCDSDEVQPIADVPPITNDVQEENVQKIKASMKMRYNIEDIFA